MSTNLRDRLHGVKSLFKRERLDIDLHLALVRSLYKPFGQIFFSTVMSTCVCAYAHWRTHDDTYAVLALVFLVVGTLRFATLVAFRAAGGVDANSTSLDAWEKLAMTGAFLFASIVGGAAGYASWTGADPTSEFLIVASALSYAAGIPGRNVARREIVMGQALLTCTPMFAGLAARDDFPHWVMATIVGLSGVLALSLASGLARTAIDRHRAEKGLRRMAEYDGLTDLRNRNGFMGALASAIAAHDQGGRLALVAIDLDRFKEVNDTHGHAAGDRVLVEVARRVEAATRAVDVAARIAGDEFHVILADVDQEEADAIAKRVLEALSRPHYLDAVTVPGGASVGTAMVERGDDVNALMVRADLTLYKSKHSGRGRATMYTAGIKSEFERRRTLELDLPRDIETDRIHVAYQPIVEVASERVRCCEALVRWNHEKLGNVPPDQFVGIAERTDCIHALGRKVLMQACVDAMGWPADVSVAVNVSPVQFERGDTLLLDVMSALATSGLPSGRLVVEVTESMLIGNKDRARDIIDRIRAVGVRVSLDDFGSGFSSLGYLGEFQFDKVKIDKTFTDKIPASERTLAIIRAVRHMSRDLGMDVVIEGVENEEQVDVIRAEGIGYVQGYVYSRPLALAAATDKITAMDRAADERDGRVVRLRAV